MKKHLMFEEKAWKNGSLRGCAQVAVRLRRPIMVTLPILWRGFSVRPFTGHLKAPASEV